MLTLLLCGGSWRPGRIAADASGAPIPNQTQRLRLIGSASASLLLLEANLPQDVPGRQAPDRTAGIDAQVDRPVGTENETGGVKKGTIAGLHGRPGRLDHSVGVNIGGHRDPTDPESFLELCRSLCRINRSGNHLYAEIGQETGIHIEVNQLLTTVRSPVSSVEQDDRPRSGADAGQVDGFAIDNRADRGKRVPIGYVHQDPPSSGTGCHLSRSRFDPSSQD